MRRVAALIFVAALALPASAGAARLPQAPVVSAWLHASRGATLTAAGRTVALPRGRVRVEAVRRSGRLTIAVGERRWRGSAHGGIRVRRAGISSRLATGRSTAALIAHRLLALRGELGGGWAPDGSAPSGRLRRTRDWKRGFYAGALWRAIDAAPEARRALEPLAWRATRALWGGEDEDTHDVGFVFGEADGGALRTVCSSPTATPDCAHAAASLRKAAATLHRLAATTPAGVIPVQGKPGCKRICAPDERKVFIDSAMNLEPLLTGTDADRALAAHHLDFLGAQLLRADGSTAQQLLLRPDGTVDRTLGHDPLAAGSTWARGQGWAVHGFAEAAEALGGPYVALAERAATWAAGRPSAPGWDWAKPAGRRNPLDTSAAAITAAGLQRVVALRCVTPPDATACPAWRAAATRFLRAATAHVSTRPGGLGRFDGQRYLWDPSRRVDYRGEYLMGTDYLLEALASRRGSSASATTRSIASGR